MKHVAVTMDELMLIKLVRERRELYDLDDPLYEVRLRRDYAWQEISDIMKEPPRDCRDKWKRLRDSYRRAQKLRHWKRERGAEIKKKSKYENILSFLNPYLKADEASSPLGPPPAADSSDSSSDGSSVVDEAHRSATCSSKCGTQTEPPNKKSKYSAVVTEPSSTTTPTHSHQTNSETKNTTQAKRDKITDFFLSLIETVKGFPEDVQIHVKRDIFKVVSDAEEEVHKNKSTHQLVVLEYFKEESEIIQ